MKTFLKNNWLLLTISFFCAVIIWIYVVYRVDPMFERTIDDIPVNFSKYSQEFSNGKLVLAKKGTETVSVRVKGKRAFLSTITSDDINCTIDMSNVTTSGTHKIPVNVSFNVSGLELVNKDPYSITVVVDDVVSNELPISVETRGRPGDGYVYDSLDNYVDKVRITGSKTIISKVKRAKVTIDLSGKTESQSGRYKIILCDKNGDALPEDGITKNISYIEVKCNILRLKEIKVSPKLSSDKNRSGHLVTATVTPSKVTVLGSKTVMANFEEILTKPIDVRNVKDGDKITVELEPLPEKAKFETKIETVEVTFKVTDPKAE